MKTTLRLTLALLLTIILVICLIPSAFAEGEGESPDYNEEEYVTVVFYQNASYYDMTTATQLIKIRDLSDGPVALSSEEELSFNNPGKEFTGWAKTAYGEKVKGVNDTVSADDFGTGSTLDLFAVWKDYATITFDKNSTAASGTMNPMKVTDEAKPLTANAFTRTGYQFMGWNTDKNGDGTAFKDEENVDTSVIIADVTLYAQWSKIFKIQYMSNGGSGIMPNQEALSGVELEIAANGFTKTGADFDSWNTKADGSGTTYKAGDKHTFKETDSDLTLYAQWTYTVTFDPNGGNGYIVEGNTDKAFEKQDYDIPENMSEGEEPKPLITRTGYAFNGWNTKADGTGDKYTDGGTIPASKVTGPITLYAQWDQEYTVNFNNTADSSQTMEPQIILKSVLDKAGATGVALNPNTFTYDGHVFTGWSKNAAGTDGHFDDGAKVKAGDFDSYATLTLYAQWKDEVVITFHRNYDTTLADKTQSVPEKTDAKLNPNTYARQGYVFDAWYTSPDGTGDRYEDGGTIPADKVEGDIELYARWIGPVEISGSSSEKESYGYVGETLTCSIAQTENISFKWVYKDSLTDSAWKIISGQTLQTFTPTSAYTGKYVACAAVTEDAEGEDKNILSTNNKQITNKLSGVSFKQDLIDVVNEQAASTYAQPGQIQGVTKNMQYSTDGGYSWSDVTNVSDAGVMSVLKPGTYIFRIKGTTIESDPVVIDRWFTFSYTTSNTTSTSTSSSGSGTVQLLWNGKSMPTITSPSTTSPNVVRYYGGTNMWLIREGADDVITMTIRPSSGSYGHWSINGGSYNNIASAETITINPVNEPKVYTIVFNRLPNSITEEIVAEINETAFPDPIFRNIVLERYDRNRDGKLFDSEIDSTKTISCSMEGINSLHGIEYFTELTTLYCSDNNLTELDLSACKSLTNLNCQGNYLTQLDLSNCPELRKLICSGNTLKALDVSNCPALASLDCSSNVLSQLKLQNNDALSTLNCSNNNLTNLDLSGNSALNSLICSGNALRQVTLAENAALVVLNCSGNLLSNLAIGDNSALRNLRCSGNLLTDLDLSGAPVLNNLECQGNRLNSLFAANCDALSSINCANNLLDQLSVSGCSVLKTLHCEQNQLTTLDLNDCGSLKTLFCYDNNISNLDLSDCPILVELVESREPVITGTWVTYGEMNEVYGGPVLRCDNIVELNTRSSIEDLTPDFILPSSLTAIEDEAFSGGAFTYVVLPDGAASIGRRAFADCPKLAYIYIPASVASIDENAFDGVEDLTIFGAPGSAADEYAGLHGFTFAAQ